MILIGQYDSSFVRRVALALRIYGLPFEHRPWSVFGNGKRIRELNPLMQVQYMVLDDGFVLVDSIYHPRPHRWPGAGKPAALAARRQAPCHEGSRPCHGLADKAVSLFVRLHEYGSEIWSKRCASRSAPP